MNSIAVALLYTLTLRCVHVIGVPQFCINLDDPPLQRWVEVAKYYREEMIAMAEQLEPILREALGDDFDTWAKIDSFDEEYTAELQGFVNTVNHSSFTLDRAKLTNMLYEMASPTACSGVLWTMPNGTVLHGRNMDYAFHFKMPDGRTLNWPDVTFEATLMKNGQPLIKMVQWPGGVGVHTAMRFGGYSFEQNTRSSNDRDANLAAAQKGAKVYGPVVRRIMEAEPDFETAVTKIYAGNFMAPQYFIMSGSGPYEGVVLTMDRNGEHEAGSPPIQRLSDSSSTAWHLVQTNDDLLAPAADPRRPLANSVLKVMDRRNVTTDNLLQFMHTPLLFNPVTVFSTVMVPATGHFKTVLPNEPPGPLAGIKAIGGSGAEVLGQTVVKQAQVPVTHPHRQRKFLAARLAQGQGDDLSALMQTHFERLET